MLCALALQVPKIPSDEINFQLTKSIHNQDISEKNKMVTYENAFILKQSPNYFERKYTEISLENLSVDIKA